MNSKTGQMKGLIWVHSSFSTVDLLDWNMPTYPHIAKRAKKPFQPTTQPGKILEIY